jgi:KTSC domain
MPLERQRLKSSAILLAEYDTDTQELTLTFSNGSSYDLSGVPPDLFNALVSSDSPGRYFNTYLKGQY